jgi:hypothetical protein
MLAVASEYDLSELQALCEASCALGLDDDNVRSMLQLAHLYGSTALKQSCFDLVQKHMATVLTNPAMVALATEDAELWTELAAAISPKIDDGGKTSRRELRTSVFECRRGKQIRLVSQ